MKLIIGGAYQGKREFAKKKYGFDDTDIFDCAEHDGDIDFDLPCVCALEEYVRRAVKNGADATAHIKSHRGEWESTVFICGDISSGIVPMGAENRLWREETGQLCSYLASEADEVYRVFCGIGMRIK